MTARFAGSRSIAERRRRRLANSSEADGVATSSALTESDELLASEPPPTSLPLRKLIPQRPWKVWAIGTVAVAVASLLLAAIAWTDRSTSTIADILARSLGLGGQRGVAAFGTITLLLCGQLALLIRWVRSRSQQDFGGQFFVWGWVSVACFASACGLALDGHRVWGDLAGYVWGFERSSQETIAWMAPTVIGYGVLLWAVLRDMDGCRLSSAVIQLAACSGLVSVLLELETFHVLPPTTRQFSQNMTALVAFVGLFQSLLLHARHVIYHSADPPAQRHSRLRNLLSGWHALAARRGRSTAMSASAVATDADDADEVSTGRKRGTAKPTARKRAKTPAKKGPATVDMESIEETSEPDVEPEQTATAPPPPAPVVKPMAAESKPAAQPAKPVPPPPAPQKPAAVAPPAAIEEDAESEDEDENSTDRTFRVDSAHGDDSLKGLSKRERRKLQKQRKDEARTGQR